MPYVFVDLPQDVTDKIQAFQALWARQTGLAIDRAEAMTELVRWLCSVCHRATHMGSGED